MRIKGEKEQTKIVLGTALSTIDKTNSVHKKQKVA